MQEDEAIDYWRWWPAFLLFAYLVPLVVLASRSGKRKKKKKASCILRLANLCKVQRIQEYINNIVPVVASLNDLDETAKSLFKAMRTTQNSHLTHTSLNTLSLAFAKKVEESCLSEQYLHEVKAFIIALCTISTEGTISISQFRKAYVETIQSDNAKHVLQQIVNETQQHSCENMIKENHTPKDQYKCEQFANDTKNQSKHANIPENILGNDVHQDAEVLQDLIQKQQNIVQQLQTSLEEILLSKAAVQSKLYRNPSTRLQRRFSYQL